MSFVISNMIYAYRGNFDDHLATKSNKITGLIDFALIASTSLIGGLIIGNVLNFGIPMGVGSSNYIAWGCIGCAGGIAIIDIIAAVLIKRNIDASLPKGEVVSREDGSIDFRLKFPSRQTEVTISMEETQKWLEDYKRNRRHQKNQQSI